MNEIPKLPLGLQMALAHNVEAMQVFLQLDDQAQEDLINKAEKAATKRELQKLVDNIQEIRLT